MPTLLTTPADTSPNAAPAEATAAAVVPPADLIAHLRERGLRLTPARQRMLAVLHQCQRPLTLAEIQARLLPDYLALATLFRSMLRMEDVELVTRSIDLHGTTTWELNVNRPRTFPVVERSTGATSLLDDDLAAPLNEIIAEIEQALHGRGYRGLQLHVTFHGKPAPALPGDRRLRPQPADA